MDYDAFRNRLCFVIGLGVSWSFAAFGVFVVGFGFVLIVIMCVTLVLMFYGLGLYCNNVVLCLWTSVLLLNVVHMYGYL